MKKTIALIAAFSVAGTFSAAVAPALTQNIALSNGPIVGNARDANGILSFKGIPYAQPPVGSLRWHAPKAATSWSNTLNTTKLGASCYADAGPIIPYFTPPSEDCLFLNVWTGAQQASEKRPVMVFITGGGFQFGSSSQPTYDGSKFAASGVILVTFNYRLGAFGFLALSELDAQGTMSGNFGLQDQLLALSWVKSNIAAFGGDPDNVTIFGESAGAHSVGLLMSSQLSCGLFHKAIMESGAFWDSEAGPLETFVQARQRGSAFEQKLGVSSVAQLRALSASTINTAAAWDRNTDPKITAFAPGIDNYVLYTNPGQAFTNGLQMKVPLLAGWNANEQALFLPYGLPHASATQFQNGATQYFGASNIPKFLTLYPDTTDAQLAASAGTLVGDMVIREQTYTALDTQHNTRGVPSNSVWGYYFTYTSPYSPSPAHTAELPFVFGNLGPNPGLFGPNQPAPTAQDAAFSKTLLGYWTNFARTGNPNGDGLPSWPAYTGQGANLLGLGNAIAPVNYDLGGLRFIRSFRTNGVLPESWRSVNVTALAAQN